MGPTCQPATPSYIVQVNVLLLDPYGMGKSVLHMIAKGGNIGMWAVMVDIFKEQGLLEEVDVDESRKIGRLYVGV